VNYNVATLSRGYKRNLKVLFWLMLLQMQMLGDEPFQFLKIQEYSSGVDAIGRMGSNNYFRKSKTRSITR
jgi:tetraacyldisaccharide-1-P 4'-kinase